MRIHVHSGVTPQVFLIKVHFFIMQAVYPCDPLPNSVLDLTVDEPVLNTQSSVLDLTKEQNSPRSENTSPTLEIHDTEPHTSLEETGHINPNPSETKETSEFSYLVKVVDPNKKGQYKVHKLRLLLKFTTCSGIRSVLRKSLAGHVPDCDDFDIGYMEPSKHGVCGKTRWIFGESDIQDMYEEYREAKKAEIIIWCDGLTKTQSKGVTTKRKWPSEAVSE